MKKIVFATVIAQTLIVFAGPGWIGGAGAPIITGPGVIETTVVEVVNPKYSVAEAIELCVNDMNERGEAVNENNLRRALKRMTVAEVLLPPKKDLNQLIRNAVQKYQARAQKKIMQNNPPPAVADYGSEKEFVTAYVAYKENNILPYEREQWSRKLGGMNEFRREKKNEAIKIWQRESKSVTADRKARKAKEAVAGKAKHVKVDK